MKGYKKLDEQWNEREVHRHLIGCTATLHEVSTEDNATVTGFLLDSLKSLMKVLMVKDHRGETGWHKAAENDSVQALKQNGNGLKK